MDRLGKADTFLSATEARVTSANRPAARAHITKQDGGTIGIGFRTLAPQLVQAPALTMSLVAKLQGKAAGVEMRAPFRVLVNQASVSKLGPVLFVPELHR